MRHRAKGRQLSRTSSHKKATLNNMATSLFMHGGIQTTEAKAKELRPFAERLITLARRGFKLLEVPVVMRERRLGHSKMSARIAREAVWRVPALRFGPRRWRGLVPEPPSADAVPNEG